MSWMEQFSASSAVSMCAVASGKERERKDLVCLNWKVPLQNIKLKLLELGWNEFHH